MTTTILNSAVRASPFGGGNPTPETTNPMRSVVNLKVKVLQVREIDENQAVGYGGTWQSKRKSKIATIALGYADGWLRSLSNSGKLIIKGHEVPYVGRVSMDAITVDITDLPGKPLKTGDMVPLLDEKMTVDDVASAAGTIGYEILTSLGHRYRRVYTES